MRVDVSQNIQGGIGPIQSIPTLLRRGATEDGDDWLYQMTPPLVMIVCTTCKRMAYGPVEVFECKLLGIGGMISRYCHRCGEATNWQEFEWHCPDWSKPLLFQTEQPDRV